MTRRVRFPKRASRLRALTLIVCVVVLAVILTQCANPSFLTDNSSVTSGGAAVAVAPQSLHDLLSAASLIVIGEVGPVERYIDFAVYGDDGQLVTERPVVDEQGTRQGDIPATEFAIKVERVLRDDGRVASGEPVLLREAGMVTEEVIQMVRNYDALNTILYPPTWTGDRRLFLLSPQPDGKAYGFRYGPQSRLVIDGELLRLTDGAQSPLQIGDSKAPVTLAEVETAVNLPEFAYAPYVPPDVSEVYPSLPTPTPAPTFDPVLYHMNLYNISREEAEARVAWLQGVGERWIAEVEVVDARIRTEAPDYVVSWFEWGPDFSYHVRLRTPSPDVEAFRATWLQGYEWADRVVVEGASE